MADQIPLRIVYVSGVPTIGEFQSGDTLGIEHGGTGVSSVAQLINLIGINNLTLSSDLLDVAIGAPLASNPVAGDSLVWTGSYWSPSAVDVDLELSSITDITISNPVNGETLVYFSSTGTWQNAVPIGGGSAVDHGLLTGLEDNDHPQYVLSATNSVLSSLVNSIEASTVALSSYIQSNSGDHSLLTNLDANDHPQYVLSSVFLASAIELSAQMELNEADILDIWEYLFINIPYWGGDLSAVDHSILSGLGDNDHPQYVLSATNQALSSLVTNVEGSTVDISSYIAANEAAWSTDNDTTDHTQLTNIGTNTHAQIDGHIADITKHFTVASIDHGSIAGLSDNDHPQYVLSSTNKALSSLVDDNTADISNLGSASANWQEAYNKVVPFDTSSPLWNSVYDQVNSLSASWEESADISYVSSVVDDNTSDITYVSGVVDGHISDITKHFTVASIDHGSIAGLGDNDHPQYVLSSTNQALSSLVTSVEGSTVSLSGYIAANESTWSTDNDTTDHTQLTNIGTNTHAQIDGHISDITKHFTVASIDHGSIAGLGDNDHPQYVLSSTNSALSSQVDSNTSAIENALDLSDITTYIEHGDLNGLGDNDHPQYVLSSTNSALSSLVTNVEGSTVSLSSYIAANESTWSTDNDTTDHTQLTNIGTNTHAQIDGHISDITKHFTVASIDHGSIAGLGDNDHPQYVLSSTNQALSSLVTSVEGSTVSLSSYIAANESTWSTDNDTTDHTQLTNIGTNTHAQIDGHIADITKHFTVASIDHGSIAGLSDNDHPQYVLSSTNQALSSLVTSVEGSTVDLSSYIAANESTWSTDNDTTDHTQLSNIGTNTHAQIDGHISDITKHFTVASIDHGSIAGLGDNDHPQYVLSSTNSALSSLVTSVEGSTVSLSAYIAANEGTWEESADITYVSGVVDSKVNKELVGHYIEPWEEGSFHQNNPTGWYSNGVSSLREFDTDPFGNQSIIWKAIDNDVASDAEGGFNSGKVPADASSTYRFSCFIKQDNTTSGNTYFGAYAFSSLEEATGDHRVDVRGAGSASGTGNNNPYFISDQPMPSTDWYLAVAYLHAYQTETGPSTRQETGLYKASTGEKVSFSIVDRVFDDPTAIGLSIRAYHFNNPAGTGDAIQFFQPRIDLVDGNEPSITDLLRIVPRTDYVLSSTNSALSSLVTSVEGSTVSLSSYIAANEGAWSTDNDTTDHTQLTNIGTNTHAQIDGHISDITKHFTVASIDHGSIAGLGDNDHPQYLLSSTYADVSSFFPSVTRMPAINSTYSGLTEWVEGSGSMSGWGLVPNTDVSSNIREYAPDPFNGSSIVWKAYDDGPGDSSPWEGGLYPESGTNISLDTSKDHRFSVFVKQHDNQDGVVYFGPISNTTPEYAIVAQSTGTHNTNPYFRADDNPEVDKWYLWVGFINASGTATGSNNYSDLAGVWSMDGDKQVVGFNEFTFSSTAVYQHLRAFYYGDGTNDGAIGASFWHPRIDALDGNEPSINDLLKRFTTQHGQLDGLDQNDHPQYVLSSTNQALSSLVTSVEGSTVSLSSYIAANESTWSTDNDTTDHTQLTNIGTNTHAQIDGHIADITKHFTVASIDHGSIAGLGDNDHPQYVLSSTNSALSSLVDDHTADISYVSGVVDSKVNKELVGHYLKPWEEGSFHDGTGVGQWFSNGTSSLREFDTDPFGNQSIIWKAIDTDVASDSEGGFDSGKVPADASSTYRYSCFIKQDNVNGNSKVYFGNHAFSSLLGSFGTARVNVRSAGTASGTGDTNPYFISGKTLPSTDWYLAVAYLHAYQTETGPSTRQETGIYKVSTGEKVSFSSITDKVFDDPSAVAQSIRAYHYYNPGGTGDVIEFFQPRIDLVDGNEPSITDLLGIVPRTDYVLSSTNSALSSLVTSVESSTIDLSSYIAANESTWSTDNDTTDHTQLTNIGTNTHAQIDGHISDITKHFTVASIDHGSIAGLGDNDHPQYVLSSTNQALSSLVTSVEGSTVSLSSYIAANEGMWSADADVSTLSGLGDVTFTDLSANQHLNWDGTNWINADNDRTEMRVRNGTASPMSRGDVIAIESAHNQSLVNVILADASQTSAMPALGILAQDLAVGEEGIAITFGRAGGLNTSGFTEGTTVYVSPTTPGQVVNAKPSGVNELIQNVGIVMSAHPSNGVIKVTGIGRSNDIDNQTRETIKYVNGTTVMPPINSSYSGLTEWTEGSGAMTDWNLHSAMEASSNVREFAPDPFNGSSIVWKAFDDGPHDTQSWEGGFFPTGSPQALDTSKPHRFSVFIKQHDNIIGSLYMGPYNTGNSAWAVVDQVTGAHDTNPYFKAGDNPAVDEWYLWVGFINASGTTTGSKNYDDLAGMYAMDGTRTNTGFDEYTFSSTAENQSLRAFYYSDSANDAQIGASLWHPRIDALDGNEPSINDLLKIYTTQHGQLDGLDQNDHPQYVLSSTNSTLSSTVDSKVNKELVGHYIAPWEEGSDSQNNPIDWTSNGTSSLREFDTDPFGNQSIIWKAIDTDVTSDNEGGFNSGKVPADASSTYRFSCFIKQENVDGSGEVYFGPYAFSSLEGATNEHRVDIRSAPAASGTGSTNRYFIGNQQMPSTDWYLAVAYLHAYQTEAGPSTRQETGIYKVSTGEKVSFTIYDLVFDDPSAIAQSIRAYQFYNPAGTGDTIQFFQPRIDLVDGNESSIADLLGIVPRTDYVLSSTNSALSSLVTSVEGSTVDLSSYIAANESTWSTDNDTTDHTQLTNIGTNTHAQIDGHISDITKHFTVASIDHGSIAGLGDNDHPQYVLSSTNQSLSSLVDDHTADITYVSGVVDSKVNKELLGHYIEPWTEGSGNQNAPTGWNNHSPSSIREFDTDPFGNQSIIWKAIDTDVTSDGEGGFNSGKVPADAISTYRFSCFIKQENTASGGAYFGCYAHSSLEGTTNDHRVDIRGPGAASGTGTTSPFFITNQQMPSTDWYLAVAYLHHYTTETSPNTRQETGVYKVSTGEKVSSFNIVDRAFDDPTAIGLTIRAFHYNNPAGTGDAIQFFQPRIDLVDGNQPSITDLLGIVPRTDYVLSSTNSALSAQVDSNTSAIDSALDLSDVSIEFDSLVSSIHHGDLSGLGDNDHPQYVLSSTNQALSSLVTSVEGSTVSLSSYIAANESTWSTDNDTTDHTQLTNIGTNTHAQIDGHISDITKHFTVASIDHGSIAGLGDNDHPQYVLSSTNQALSSLVDDHTADISYVSGVVDTNTSAIENALDLSDITTYIEHGDLNGLGDNDHPQYVLSSTNQALSSLVTSVEGSTVSLSGYIAANESTWSTDNDTTDHTQLTNIGTNTHAQIDSHIADITKHFTVASIDHGSIAGLGDNDHPQYLLSSTYADVSSFFPSVTRMPAINSSYSGLTEWTEGSGAMTDWVLFPGVQASSNIREYAPDPFNGSSIVWKAFDDGPHDTNPYEGGVFPTGSSQPIDASKSHRFSVFIKQHDNTIGSLLMGPHNTSNPLWAVVNQLNGVHNTNPYFEASVDNPEVDEWYLWVGFINASGTTTGSKNYDDLAGIYAMDGTRASAGFDEYTFSSTATNQSLRAFYYSDSANDAQIGASFWHPRMDALDGNEPSINDLLKIYTTQHGQLDGLDQNDHPQYVLSSTNSALSSLVDDHTADISYVSGVVDSKVNKEILGHYLKPWEEGSSHDGTTTGGWLSNDASSLREFDTDPFGNQSIIWKAIDDDVASDAEGGFNSARVPADSSSTYRYSCFIKQENVDGSGKVYFGNFAYNSLSGSYGASLVNVRGSTWASGTGNTNPYFIANRTMPSTDWYLAVAYLHPYQTETGPSTRQETGIYKASTGEKVSITITDLVFDDPSAVGQAIRAYHYYNPAGTGDVIQFFQPRIDLVDGNEPSISDLLRIVPRTDYVLSSTNQALSSLVTSVEGSTVSLSSYIAANESAWSTDNDTTDHTQLTNIGTNTHAQIDGHISDITKHFTVASIDHGSIAGLGDNDHPQYVLSSTNSALSSLVTNVEGSTVSLSSYIAANESTWSTDNDTTDHTALSNIGTNTHAQIDSHISDITKHFTVASIDHGSIAGLGDNDHPQYVLSGVPTMSEGGSSVTGVGACPHPQPFWYGQTTADSTASRSYDWGSAATETEVVCSDHFNWDAANSRLYVSSTGVYEVDVMFMIDGGSNFTANVIVKVDGTAKNTLTHDYVSANSPSEYSGRWVGKVSAGSYITATFQDAAVSVSTSHEAGSTMIVKRLA